MNPMEEPEVPEKLSNVVIVSVQPSEDFIRAVIMLRDNEHFQTVVRELKARSVQLALSSCIVNDDKFCHWTQGRVQELRETLGIIENAEKNLENRRRQRATAAQAQAAMS